MIAAIPIVPPVVSFIRHRPPSDEYARCFALARTCFAFVAHELGKIDRQTAATVVDEICTLSARYDHGPSKELDAMKAALAAGDTTRLVVLPLESTPTDHHAGGCDKCDSGVCPRSRRAAAA